jgi:hypothetical protein
MPQALHLSCVHERHPQRHRFLLLRRRLDDDGKAATPLKPAGTLAKGCNTGLRARYTHPRSQPLQLVSPVRFVRWSPVDDLSAVAVGPAPGSNLWEQIWVALST